MIDRYSRKELKNIWEDKNKYNIWLQIEIAAAEAINDSGFISENEKSHLVPLSFISQKLGKLLKICLL